MQEWVELERLARETLRLIDDGLAQRPGDSELLLRRAVAQYNLGKALLPQGNAAESVSVLEQALKGFRDTPPVFTFTDNQELYAGYTEFALVESLLKTGNLDRARSLAEGLVPEIESRLARQPESRELRTDFSQCLVLLAGILDPAKADESARRQSLLDRAVSILNSPDMASRHSAEEKELLTKADTLRRTTKQGTAQKL
jgi:tetratricopeptide (TPR) repeat protein